MIFLCFPYNIVTVNDTISFPFRQKLKALQNEWLELKYHSHLSSTCRSKSNSLLDISNFKGCWKSFYKSFVHTKLSTMCQEVEIHLHGHVKPSTVKISLQAKARVPRRHENVMTWHCSGVNIMRKTFRKTGTISYTRTLVRIDISERYELL